MLLRKTLRRKFLRAKGLAAWCRGFWRCCDGIDLKSKGLEVKKA
jgi:hypothetical protein